MRMCRRSWLLCLTALATGGCSDQSPTAIRKLSGPEHLLVPGDPATSGDGTSQRGFVGETVVANLLGDSPHYIGSLQAGFLFTGESGYIQLFPEMRGFKGARLPDVIVPPFTIDPGSPSQFYATPVYSVGIEGICGVVAGGAADFYAQWVIGGTVFHGPIVDKPATPVKGPDCKPPTVTLNPQAISVDANTQFTVYAVFTAQSGTLTSANYVLDNGAPRPADLTALIDEWTGSVSCGNHTLKLTATNSVGLSASTSTSIIASNCDDNTSGGGGGGGSGGWVCYYDTRYYIDTGEIIDSTLIGCLQVMP